MMGRSRGIGPVLPFFPGCTNGLKLEVSQCRSPTATLSSLFFRDLSSVNAINFWTKLPVYHGLVVEWCEIKSGITNVFSGCPINFIYNHKNRFRAPNRFTSFDSRPDPVLDDVSGSRITVKRQVNELFMRLMALPGIDFKN